jgi:hypothetical protein
MTDISQSDSALRPSEAPPPSVVESVPTVSMPSSEPLPASTEAPHDLDLPADDPRQPQPTTFLDNVGESELQPPRSWNREQLEHWAALPEETKAYIAQREQERETFIGRKKNEADREKYAAEAERQRAEQARQEFEAALPQSYQMHLALMSREFSDIQSEADVERLAAEDPARYARWHQDLERVKVLQEEVVRRQIEAHQIQAHQLAQWAKAEDAKFRAKATETADPGKFEELQKEAMRTLEHAGFTPEEIRTQWAAGALRDHRAQLLLRDATMWRLAQARARTIAPVNHRPLTSGALPPHGAPVKSDLQRLADAGNMGAYIAARNRGKS